jgi:hypothetical protein
MAQVPCLVTLDQAGDVTDSLWYLMPRFGVGGVKPSIHYAILFVICRPRWTSG